MSNNLCIYFTTYWIIYSLRWNSPLINLATSNLQLGHEWTTSQSFLTQGNQKQIHWRNPIRTSGEVMIFSLQFLQMTETWVVGWISMKVFSIIGLEGPGLAKICDIFFKWLIVSSFFYFSSDLWTEFYPLRFPDIFLGLSFVSVSCQCWITYGEFQHCTRYFFREIAKFISRLSPFNDVDFAYW